MRLGARGPNTKDSWPIGRIERDQRMYDCYGKPRVRELSSKANAGTLTAEARSFRRSAPEDEA
jgi:hypothetical protein